MVGSARPSRLKSKVRVPSAYARSGALPATGVYGAVIDCGPSVDEVVEPRIGTGDAGVPAGVAGEPVSVVQAARPPAPARASNRVRLRMVTFFAPHLC